MNLVFKSAQADYILMMSDDTIFHENAVQAGLDFIKEQTAQGKKVGAVPFYFHDIAFDDPHEYKVHTLLNVPMLNHGIYLREAFAGVGFADEDQYQFYGADNDICLKLVHAGYEILPCKTALMLHCPNHPTRYMTTSSKQWVQDATALLSKWRGIFVDEHVKVEDLSLVNWFVTYQDPTNLAKTFDVALAAAAKADADPTATHTTDMAVRIEYMDSRLNNVLSAIRYNIQLTEQYHRDWLQIRHYDKKPLYWRILATWAIFKPLRNMKKR
ncbi:MAG TPA: hypothetical protein PLZ51_23445, partial [Aggregatilineales bacterium]|nr:hypothetical protein [Aggregatilineales bacterium]